MYTRQSGEDRMMLRCSNKCFTKYQYQFDALYGHFVDLQLVSSVRSQNFWKSNLNTMAFNKHKHQNQTNLNKSQNKVKGYLCIRWKSIRNYGNIVLILNRKKIKALCHSKFIPCSLDF